MAAKTKFKDRDMQVVIGWVLRLGVIISVSIVIFGGAFYLERHGSTTVDYRHFTGVPYYVQLKGIFAGIMHLRGRSIIQAGIIMLIATPILRILFSAIGFVFEKDYLYVGISLLVLLIIFISAVNGYTG